jgi:hypothetical protein
MYKLVKPLILGESPNSVNRIEDGVSIPFAQDNTDYANFKAQIMADEAELQDAEGVTMSPDAAKNFVKELP